MFRRVNLDLVAGPYLMPYVYKRRILDKQYVIRTDGVIFKIGDSPVLVHQYGDITMKDNEFRGSKVLWELLTRNNVNKEHLLQTI